MADISTRSKEATDLLLASELCRHLMEGNRRLRQLGQLYLPILEGETAEKYQVRINNNYLFNGFKAGVETNCSRIFAKPIILEDDVPVEIKGDPDHPELAGGLIEDIDLCGRHLQVVLGDWFQSALVSRCAWCFVDMRAESPGEPPRPYWRLYTVENFLGCNNGAHRFEECSTEPDESGWGEKEVKRIRAIWPDRYEVHIKTDAGWVLDVEMGPGGVLRPAAGPLLDVNGNPLDEEPVTCLCLGDSLPFETLAEVCRTYWQSNSRQRVLLDFARQLIIHRAGASGAAQAAVIPAAKAGDAPKVLPNTVALLGAAMLFASADASAHMEYVEHKGSAIEAGRQDLADLREMMAQLTLDPMLRRQAGTTPAPQTATGSAIEADQINSVLQGWAGLLRDAAEKALQTTARWLGLPSGGSITIPTMPGLAILSADAANLLMQMRKNRDISRRTLWASVGEYLPEDFDADVEEERLAEEQGIAEDTAAELDAVTATTGTEDPASDPSLAQSPPAPVPPAPQYASGG